MEYAVCCFPISAMHLQKNAEVFFRTDIVMCSEIICVKNSRLTRRRVIEGSADALPYTPGARYTGKYAGDCKTNTV